MRITENFVNPRATGGGAPQQISVNLEADHKAIELRFSSLTPVIRAQDVGILIGMLEALKRRAGA